ncbi:Ionotropic receptor 165 [Frankliniella occidentalis]|nr:Ionotropic receptor 165 [Frankliniella occidentalis]
MDVTVVLVLVFTTAPWAHSALPDVDMTAAPEATSALALLSPFLAAQKTTLLILGQVNWTRDFLRGLSQDTSWVLFPDEKAQNDRFQGNFGVKVNCTALVVSDNPADPYSWMERNTILVDDCYFLFWMTTGSGVLPEAHYHLFCEKPTGLAVTTPNGSTTLYILPPKSCVNANEASPPLVEVDRWSPADLRWRRADAVFRLFHPFCSRWRPPAEGESLTVYELTGAEAEASSLPEYFKTMRTRVRGLQWTTNVESNPVSFDVNLKNIFLSSQNIWECQLSLMLLEVGDVMQVNRNKVSVMAEKRVFEISAFVPAGLGPAVNPLDAVLVEFSMAVWMGTVLAALSTAAALACTLRRDHGAALLLALAPLLGQAPGTPPPAGRALRPLLGVWLLVCVVLVAAYQGLLLGELSTERAHTEVNSLRALRETGLPIYLTWDSVRLLKTELFPNFDAKQKFSFVTNVGETLQHVAQHRNCAMIAIQDRTLRRLAQRLFIPHKKVHSFPIVAEDRRLIAAWSPGSPLGELSRSTYERLDQAGILDHWEDKLDQGNKVALARYLVALQQVRALTLKHMAPAFYVLFIGLALATLALGVELATARWCRARGRTATPAGRPGSRAPVCGGQDVRRRRPAAALRLRAPGPGAGPLHPQAGPRRASDILLVPLHRGSRRTAWW